MPKPDLVQVMRASIPSREIATVGVGGRIRIPKKVLDELDAQVGDQVIFFLPEKGKVVMMANFASVTVNPPIP